MDCVDPRVSYNELVQGEIEYDADSGRPIYSIKAALPAVLESPWPVKREISRLEKEVLKELDLDLEG